MEEPDRGQGKVVIEQTNGKQEKTVAVEEPVPCYACCLASRHPLPDSPSLGTRLHHALLCPPHGTPALFISYIIALGTIWAVAYCLLGQVALPGTKTIEVSIHGGTVFSLLALLTVSLIMGWVMEKLHMPPLLGMLLTGPILPRISLPLIRYCTQEYSLHRCSQRSRS